MEMAEEECHDNGKSYWLFTGAFWRDNGKRRVSLTGRASVDGLGIRRTD